MSAAQHATGTIGSSLGSKTAGSDTECSVVALTAAGTDLSNSTSAALATICLANSTYICLDCDLVSLQNGTCLPGR